MRIMKVALLAVSLLLVFLFCGCTPPADIAWKCTTPKDPWQDMPPLHLEKSSLMPDVSIDTSALGQEIAGFGGAFNEKGWIALSVLSLAQRDAVMQALFDPVGGAKFNICRVPIGASDYAVSRYTLDETKDDFGMQDFSIERDKRDLIPYIKAAIAYAPELKVWGSAWTPPTWMNTNGDYDGGSMKDDPAVYRAYALYLARFVEAYRAEGIGLFVVAVQNEPRIARHYPSCLWSPAQFGTFIRDYMGPLFRQRDVKASIMLGTIQDANFSHYPALLDDPDINQYVSIVGYQYDGLLSVPPTRRLYPEKQICQTETVCGNAFGRPGYDPYRPQNDWSYGIYTWGRVKAYFDAGVNAYMLWNMVLDEEGKNIDSQAPWPQNAAITVDQDTKKVTYTPMFYAFKHFSAYVQPGARYNYSGDKDYVISFLNPDGSLVIVVQNPSSDPRHLSIRLEADTIGFELPGLSWNTLVVPVA